MSDRAAAGPPEAPVSMSVPRRRALQHTLSALDPLCPLDPASHPTIPRRRPHHPNRGHEPGHRQLLHRPPARRPRPTSSRQYRGNVGAERGSLPAEPGTPHRRQQASALPGRRPAGSCRQSTWCATRDVSEHPQSSPDCPRGATGPMHDTSAQHAVHASSIGSQRKQEDEAARGTHREGARDRDVNPVVHFRFGHVGILPP